MITGWKWNASVKPPMMVNWYVGGVGTAAPDGVPGTVSALVGGRLRV
jgi:hypothetical protein